MPIERSADSDTDTFEFTWGRGPSTSGDNCLQDCDVAQVARKQADRVETGAQMADAAAIDSSETRLVHAAKCRWQNGRTAGL